ncbi:MAG: hypothetical protein IK093_00315 [Ruminiclostridium sp.]|nr:hypothetical protein [Ruminiclostridium sp.]
MKEKVVYKILRINENNDLIVTSSEYTEEDFFTKNIPYQPYYCFPCICGRKIESFFVWFNEDVGSFPLLHGVTVFDDKEGQYITFHDLFTREQDAEPFVDDIDSPYMTPMGCPHVFIEWADNVEKKDYFFKPDCMNEIIVV